MATSVLPAGVQLHPLKTHADHRGSLTEVFREEWSNGVKPVQWTFVTSAAGSVRGVHVHVTHDDVVIVLEGQMTLGLHDVREGSPTNGVGVAIDLSAAAPTVAIIPHGVIHGFLFGQQTTVLIGATSYYDPADDVECLWSDPELQIPWPAVPTIISDRDRGAGSLSALIERVRPWQPFGLGRSADTARGEQPAR